MWCAKVLTNSPLAEEEPRNLHVRQQSCCHLEERLAVTSLSSSHSSQCAFVYLPCFFLSLSPLLSLLFPPFSHLFPPPLPPLSSVWMCVVWLGRGKHQCGFCPGARHTPALSLRYHSLLTKMDSTCSTPDAAPALALATPPTQEAQLRIINLI